MSMSSHISVLRIHEGELLTVKSIEYILYSAWPKTAHFQSEM